MATHPTIVHAAADLRRHALLSEAADDWRTTTTSGRMKSTGPGKVCRRMVAQITAVVSRVIDDFEPGPGEGPPTPIEAERVRRAGLGMTRLG